MHRAVEREATLSSVPLAPAPLEHHTANNQSPCFPRSVRVFPPALFQRWRFGGGGCYQAKKRAIATGSARVCMLLGCTDWMGISQCGFPRVLFGGWGIQAV